MKLKVLTLTTLYPNKEQPVHAVFVKNRIVALSKLCNIKIVAPIPSSFILKLFSKKYRLFSKIPSYEISDSIEIFHPRYLVTPKIGRNLYGFMYFFSIIGFVLKLIKNYNFDILDVHWAYPDGFAGILLAKILNKPISITVRGSDINEFTKFFLRRKMIVYALKRANKVIAVSRALGDKINTLVTAKISVIPNGVDISKFYLMEREMAREKLGLPKDRKIILSVGRLGFPKRFDILIEAVYLLVNSKKINDVLLLIVGDGEYYEKLNEQINSLKLSYYVKLVGRKLNDELVYWYNSADIFCLSTDSEGFPNVIFESLACGTPAVVSAVGGVAEVIISEEYGFLVNNNTAEAFCEVINRALIKKWGRNKLAEYAKKNTWDNVAYKVYEEFKSILKE